MSAIRQNARKTASPRSFSQDEMDTISEALRIACMTLRDESARLRKVAPGTLLIERFALEAERMSDIHDSI